MDDVAAVGGSDTGEPIPGAAGSDAGLVVDAAAELSRLGALPLEERAGALAAVVQRLEGELDATEARPAGT